MGGKESGENAQEQMQESGGNQEEPIVLEDGYHQRDNMCNVSFPIWSTERDGIRYGFDQNGFTKEEATDYVREMGQSVAVIREKMIDTGVFMRDTECQVLVLNDSPATAISASKEVLVLDKNSLEKEEYGFFTVKVDSRQLISDLIANGEREALIQYVQSKMEADL